MSGQLPQRRPRTSNNGLTIPAHCFLLPLGGRSTVQFQAPIVQTMFQRCLPYCRVEFDTCLAGCLTCSISTHSGKLDGKEAFGRHAFVVLKMQSLPSGFQSGNGSDHSRVLSVTFSCRLFMRIDLPKSFGALMSPRRTGIAVVVLVSIGRASLQ